MILSAGRVFLEAVDSTQSVALEAARNGAPVGIVWTRHQTRGRGRFDRVWESPAGTSLTASFTVCDLPRESWLLGMAIGLALAEAFDLAVQWPNDLVIEGRKVGGILTEIVGDFGIVGCGLNLTQESFPTGLFAASLLMAGRDPLTQEEALDRAESAIAGFARPDSWQDLATLWAQRDATPGKAFRAASGQTLVATRVDSRGRLVARDPQGTEHILTAAEALYG